MNDQTSDPTHQPKVVVTPIAAALGAPTTPVSERISAHESLRGVWLGQPGALRMEVCEIVSDREPNVLTIRTVWHKRRARRAVPLIVFWQGPNRVILTEPTGEPVSLSVVQAEPAAALSIITRALSCPAREAVSIVRALLERTQGSGGVAGFRNRNLLSTHYLTVGFRRQHSTQWIELDNVGARIRSQQGGKLLRELGYAPTDNPSTYEVVVGGRPRVHALVLPNGASFDRSAAGPGDAPATRVIVEARSRGADRAVLVAGSILRIYPANGGHGLNDLATAGTYIELDLDILGNEWSALLPLLFSAESNAAAGLFDLIAVESSRYAIGLRERFRERVYENVVAGLIKALYDARGRKRADADLLYNATLRLLYRLLFVLYAEDRNLLPLGNPEYRRISLTETLFRIEQMRQSGKAFDERQTTLWDDLFRIFDAIRGGSKEWNVPAYNGGLFEPRLNDHPEAAFLHSIKLANAVLAPILLSLAFDDEEGERGKVDFGDLGVRHLGTLYEGLLSYSVHIADFDLTVDSDGMYVPAKSRDEVYALAGEPYLTSPKGGRKATGSYYTPSFAVRRLVDNALRPALEEHLERVLTLPHDRQWDAMLDFRVVDPAMGSGHFLVDALDAVSDRLARFLRDNPRISASPIERARTQITLIGKEYAIDGLGESVGDFELLRRNVMRSCIYGVDMNPMAVELCKLSLWLHAFVPGLPLSYLGHNLRCGNALIGLVGHEIQGQLTGNLFGDAVSAALNSALEYSRKIASSSDLSPDEVHASEAAQAGLEDTTEKLSAAFDAYACRVFAVDEKAKSKGNRERGRGLLEQGDGLNQILLGQVKGEDKAQIAKAQRVADNLRAFHWQLAFPEVFLGGRGGFDVVLGNPPWEKIKVERLNFFAQYIPGIKSVFSQSERERLIKRYESHHSDVAKAYADEIERNAELSSIIRANYSLAKSGDTDMYRAFAELALNLTKINGTIGMVYPRTLLASDGTAPYRKRLFSEYTVVADFGVNTGGWIFPDVHPQYSIIALAARKDGGRLVYSAGPAASEAQWRRLPDVRTAWTYDELLLASPGMEVPLIADPKYGALFRKMLLHGKAFSAQAGDARFRPWTPLHGTADRKSGLLKERGSDLGWPVFGGRNFYLWQPDIGETEFVLDGTSGIQEIQRKRLRSDVWADVDRAVVNDVNTIPYLHAHILFRDVARNNDSRTVIAALAPPMTFSTHKAPVLIQIGGNALDCALRLAIMCSLPFDWIARRRVETNLTYGILNALPVPKTVIEDSRARRAAELSAALCSVDPRYSEFAAECGVGIASLSGDARDSAIAEIDALVVSMYDLDDEDIETIFSGFTLDAVPDERRRAVRHAFARIKSAGLVTT